MAELSPLEETNPEISRQTCRVWLHYIVLVNIMVRLQHLGFSDTVFGAFHELIFCFKQQ